ncbi:MAG TPA: AAA family ATPase [Solirubrobacteraceae bacterium]|nr:AAA family ATPase [Solirubrobacteraceae bacterium]
MRGVEQPRKPFVGRAEELSALERSTDRARAGNPTVVVLEGDPGIGKSSLLTRVASTVADAAVVRASGDETESMLAFGVARQLLDSAAMAIAGRPGAARELVDIPDGSDPLVVAGQLRTLLRSAERATDLVVLIVDDLPWADRASAATLLAALRSLHTDHVLALLAARPGQLARLGDEWSRFVAGDHRCDRLRVTGMTRHELIALGEALGAGRLPGWAANLLAEHTGGNPLHCCALLEELEPNWWTRSDRLPAPRALSSLVLARLGSLSQETQRLVSAAAVLGRRCRLENAARLAELADPIDALDEACRAGLVVESQDGPTSEISFSHALVHRAIYDDLGPARRRRMHRTAVDLVGWRAALGHRVAAASGPDEQLARDLEAAARDALGRGQSAQAASWLALASAASATMPERERRVLDALEVLVDDGAVAEAERLLARGEDPPATARRSVLTGELDLLAGRVAEGRERLMHAWEARHTEPDEAIGARAALLLASSHLFDGRLADAIVWIERAAGARAPSLARRVLALRALIFAVDGREHEGLRLLESIPAAPSEVPLAETDLLVARGMAKLPARDLESVIADLTTAAERLRLGGADRSTCQCLSWLAAVEYHRGAWDDALAHGELAVEMAVAQDRVADLGLAQAHAALVPAGRGDWTTAAAYSDAAHDAAERLGSATVLAAAVTARASLATARGRPDETVRAADGMRDHRGAKLLERIGPFGWRSLEVDALITLGEFTRAETALRELAAARPARLARGDVLTTSRLSGNLARARGDVPGAERHFSEAWYAAELLEMPLALAQLEVDDARRLRHDGRRPEAIGRLRSARVRLERLQARPYLEVCDRELAACGVIGASETRSGSLGLTPAETAVADLVAAGNTNRQVAAELFLSVKTVEFHLRNIFAKLDIRGRRELAVTLGVPQGRRLG